MKSHNKYNKSNKIQNNPLIYPLQYSLIYALIFALTIALAQITKYLASTFLDIGESKKVLPFLYLTHAQNTGASFSILQGKNILLTILAIVVLFIVIYVFYKEKNTKVRIIIAFFSAGLVGNLIDRLIFGSVTDFIDFRIWPIFNIADSAITLSVIALIYFSLIEKR